ncbi:hypothetical protein C1645_839596 [Glomus cerebriforme]|uniref:Uncharacterized protein n=1 Tax=Glomus cerebriforme TaxID=658196 RepID=A0A397S1V0_9GLOM|nr:hypothetical protein C1645_839596 [Glomus cerebriforme]
MSCTLTVIGLVTRLRVSNQITNGDAIYRKKVSNQTCAFGLKQFTNARHEYNEQFKEGDLVFFGGKFTLDEEKLVLLVEMAHVIEPKIGPNGEYLKWEPTEIISTKLFVNIFTTATEPLSTFENINFVKTRSLIYTLFHSIAKYVNFEIGYQKDSKWLESITEKWKDYASFFIGSFIEAIYTLDKQTYIQINVKLINYDVRFHQSNTSNQSITSLTNQSISVFTMRINKSASPSTPKLSSTNTITMNDYIPNSRSSTITMNVSTPKLLRTNSITMDDVQKSNDDIPNKDFIKETDSIVIDDNESASQSATLTSNFRQKKHQLSDLCNSEDEFINEFDNESVNDLNPIDTPKNNKRGKGGRGARGARGAKGRKK